MTEEKQHLIELQTKWNEYKPHKLHYWRKSR